MRAKYCVKSNKHYVIIKITLQSNTKNSLRTIPQKTQTTQFFEDINIDLLCT